MVFLLIARSKNELDETVFNSSDDLTAMDPDLVKNEV